MRPDQAPEGGKFRAVADAGMDGDVGVWGDDDLLCVQLTSTGTIDVSAAGACDGVIWTKEGRKEGVASNNAVIGGKKYTVFTFAEFVDADTASSPALSAGDDLYATALGDVTASPATLDVYVGSVMEGGGRLLINVNGRPASP